MQLERSVSHQVGAVLCLTHIQRKQGPQSHQSRAAFKTNKSGPTVGEHYGLVPLYSGPNSPLTVPLSMLLTALPESRSHISDPHCENMCSIVEMSPSLFVLNQQHGTEMACLHHSCHNTVTQIFGVFFTASSL